MSTQLVEWLCETALIIGVTLGVTVASYVALFVGALLFVYFVAPPQKEPPEPRWRYPQRWG